MLTDSFIDDDDSFINDDFSLQFSNIEIPLSKNWDVSNEFSNQQSLERYFKKHALWISVVKKQNITSLIEYFNCNSFARDKSGVNQKCKAQLKVERSKDETKIIIFKNRIKHNHEIIENHNGIKLEIARLYDLGFDISTLRTIMIKKYTGKKQILTLEFCENVIKAMNVPHLKISQFLKRSYIPPSNANIINLELTKARFIPIMYLNTISKAIEVLEKEKFWIFKIKVESKLLCEYFYYCNYSNPRSHVKCNSILLFQLNFQEESLLMLRTILYHDHNTSFNSIKSAVPEHSITSLASQTLISGNFKNESPVKNYKKQMQKLFTLGFDAESVIRYHKLDDIHFDNNVVYKYFEYMRRITSPNSLIECYRKRWQNKQLKLPNMSYTQQDWYLNRTLYSVDEVEKLLASERVWIFCHKISTLRGFQHHYKCSSHMFKLKPCCACIYFAFNAQTLQIRLYNSKIQHNHNFIKENSVIDNEYDDDDILITNPIPETVVINDDSGDECNEPEIGRNENTLISAEVFVGNPLNGEECVKYIISEVLEDVEKEDSNIVHNEIEKYDEEYIDWNWEKEIDEMIQTKQD